MARLFDDGSSEYLETDNAVFTAAPFTMAAWFNSNDDTALQTLIQVCDKDATNHLWALALRGNNPGDQVTLVRLAGGGPDFANTSAGFTANTWHHACGVAAAADDVTVYIDGGNTGTSAVSLSPAGADRTSIGRAGDSSPANYMSGAICEAAIWNTDLSAAEVAILAHGYSPLFVKPENLVAYWPLIRDEDQDRIDGYDMTAYNTPGVTPHTAVIYPVSPIVCMVTGEAVRIPRYGYTLYQIPAVV